jgi:uncharacterized repeat protein (TIGR01451 family)
MWAVVTPSQAAPAHASTTAVARNAPSGIPGAYCGTTGDGLIDGSGCIYTFVGTDTFKAPYYQPRVTFTVYGAKTRPVWGKPYELGRRIESWGGMVKGTLAPNPGEVYQVNVGGPPTGPGRQEGGFNGGGDGGAKGQEDINFSLALAGAGASDVRSGSYGLPDRLFVAGGAGGDVRGTDGAIGGDGGGVPNGGTGDSRFGSGGGGGTQTHAGSSPGNAGSAGRGFGGSGGLAVPGLMDGGAGGGGGYFGGGGSGAVSDLSEGVGGGGGGSGYITPLATDPSSKSGGQYEFYRDGIFNVVGLDDAKKDGRGVIVARWPPARPTASVAVTSSHAGTIDPETMVTLTTRVTTSTGVAPEGYVRFVDYTNANGAANPRSPEHCPCYNVTGDIIDRNQDGTYVKRIRASALEGGPGHTIVATFEDLHDELETVKSAPVSFRERGDAVDLGLTLTGAPDPVTVGDDITYTLGVTNHSTSPATAVRPQLNLRDAHGGDVTFRPAKTSSFCTEAYTVVTCDFGGIAPGATKTATVVVTANRVGEQMASATFFNTAEPDPNPANDWAETSTQVHPADQTPSSPQARLSISKTGPARAVVGNDITYRLAVGNQGPDLATGVVATDVLPDGVTFKSAGTSSECTNLSGTVSCDIGDVGVGTTKTVDVVVTADAVGAISNTATVRGNEDDPSPNPIFHSSTATTQVIPASSADLAIEVTGPERTVYRADTTYRLTVTNTGPNAATGVVATDVLPEGARFKAAGTSRHCTPNLHETIVTCDFGEVAVGATKTADIVVLHETIGLVPNTVTITGEGPDPHLSNNSSTATMRVQDPNSPADLAIEKTAPGRVTVGEDITYRLVVTNNSSRLLRGVQAIDRLPAGVTFKRAGTSTICTHASGTVTCDFGLIASFDTATVNIVTTADRAGTVSNTATVDGIGVDPHPEDNASTATTQVDPDTTPPVVTIESGPSGRTSSARPTYAFAADEEVTFACRVVAQGQATTGFDTCSGPAQTHQVANPLADGAYTFEVRATDLAGNVTSVTRDFTVTALACLTSAQAHERAQADLASARAGVTAAETAVADARPGVDAGRDEVSAERGAVSDAHAVVTDAKSAATLAQGGADAARSDATAALAAVADAEGDVEGAQAQLDAARADLAAAETDVVDARDMVDTAEGRVAEKSADVTSAEQAVAAADERIQEARSELARAQRALIEADTALEGSHDRATRAQSTLTQTETELADARAALTRTDTDVSRAFTRKDVRSARLARARKDLAKAKRTGSPVEVTKARAVRDVRRARFQQARAALVSARTDRRAVRVTLGAAETAYVAAHGGWATAVTHQEADERRLVEARATAGAAQGAATEASETRRAAGAALAAAQQELDTARTHLAAARDELGSARSGVSVAEDALAEARGALTRADDQLDAARAALTEAGDRLRAAKKALIESEDDLAAAEATLAEAEESLARAEQALTEANEELTAAEARLTDAETAEAAAEAALADAEESITALCD